MCTQLYYLFEIQAWIFLLGDFRLRETMKRTTARRVRFMMLATPKKKPARPYSTQVASPPIQWWLQAAATANGYMVTDAPRSVTARLTQSSSGGFILDDFLTAIMMTSKFPRIERTAEGERGGSEERKKVNARVPDLKPRGDHLTRRRQKNSRLRCVYFPQPRHPFNTPSLAHK